MTRELVLQQAEKLSFPCQINEQNCWQILPIKEEETWKLTEIESKWILSLRNVPQLRLSSEEAIAFLKSRT